MRNSRVSSERVHALTRKIPDDACVSFKSREFNVVGRYHVDYLQVPKPEGRIRVDASVKESSARSQVFFVGDSKEC